MGLSASSREMKCDRFSFWLIPPLKWLGLFLVPLILGCRPANPATSSILLSDEYGTVWRVYSVGQVERITFEFHTSRCSGTLHFGTTCPVPSPDKQLIAFTRDNDLWLFELKTSRASQVSQLGRPDTERYASVFVLITDWSPDSRQLLYSINHGDTEDPEGYSPTLEVFPHAYGYRIYDLQSAVSRPLSLPGNYLAWLPSGDFLLSSAEVAPVDQRSLRFKPGGKHPELLTHRKGWYGQMAMSGDGRWLLTGVSQKFGAELTSQIIKIDLLSGAVADITPLGGFAEYQYPQFSPSGTHVSYIRRLGPPQQPRFNIIIDGTSIYQETGRMPEYRWITDDSLVVLDPGERSIVVLDTVNGRVKGRHQLNPPRSEINRSGG